MESLSTSFEEYLDKIEAEVHELQEGFSSIDNPIDSFKIIKRLVKDWNNFTNEILSTSPEDLYKDNLKDLANFVAEFPNEEDVIGASKGLARLQKTYKLKTVDLADGVIMDRGLSSPMTVSECFNLGKRLLSVDVYDLAVTWLFEAYRKLKNDSSVEQTRTNTKYLNDSNMETLTTISSISSKPDHVDLFPANESIILEHLINALYRKNSLKLALHLANGELHRNPENNLIREIHTNITQSLENGGFWDVLDSENEWEPDDKEGYENIETDSQQKLPIKELYEMTCRGERKFPPHVQRDLLCRYTHNNVAFRLIAPFKMEQLSLDPFVAIFHEVIFENEVKAILSKTNGYMERTRTGPGVNNSRISDIRISKAKWFSWNEHSFLRNFYYRLQHITNLTLETGEALQVANYGIGGHYASHHDFADGKLVGIYKEMGNRILTALLYLNSVDIGGGTAFPHLGLLVPPTYKSLLIWYNMHADLSLDYRTLHAGCPVLKGSKWIANEWFHERGQEFKRPCSIERHAHKSIQYKDII